VETLEERLRRELQHLSPPGDPSGVVDGVLRRAARRHARRSVGIALLTLSVIAGSIGGFYGLSRVFSSPQRNAASGPANGLIVFSDIRVAGFDEHGANVVDDWHLYTLDPIDGRVTRIGPDSVDEALFPTWSPDGMRIAFVGFRDRRASVYVAAADGSNVEEILTPAEGQQIEGLRWSPNGSRIGYQLAQPGSGDSTTPVGDRSWTIWTMAADGTDRRQVTTAGREMHFSWSPDGTRIVFERFRPIIDVSQLGDAATDLYVIDADGSDEVRLTNDGMSRDPAWSPDGTQIAFSHGPRGDQRLALIGVDGSGLRDMTPRPEAGTFFPYGNTIAWSPDGEQIAFTGHGIDDVCFISTLDVAEGSVRTLVSSPASRSCPGQEGMSWTQAVATEMPTPTETTKPTPGSEPSISEETLEIGGVHVEIPSGWSGRVYYIHGYTRPVLRLATFVLPETDDIEASMARSLMQTDDVLVNLTEYTAVCPCPGFDSLSPPYTLRNEDLEAPFDVWHDLPPQEPDVPPDRSLGRRTFEAEHRFFDLWVEFGHAAPPQDAVDTVNGVLASFSIGDFEPPLQPDGLCNEWSLNKDPDCPKTIWIKSVLAKAGFSVVDSPQEATLVGEGVGARFFIWVREPTEPLESFDLKRYAVIEEVQVYGGSQRVWRAQTLNVWIAPGPDGQDVLPDDEQLARLVKATLTVNFPPTAQ
jgi:hypothetical protein